MKTSEKNTTEDLQRAALARLSAMAWAFKIRQCPSVPAFAIRRPKYSEANSNNLTAAIRDFLKMAGHHCNRVNTQGQWRQDLGRFVHSGSTRGAADLNCIISGRSVQVEIKRGRDRLSEVQERQKQSVIAAGGSYLEVRSFFDFIVQYSRLTGIPYDGVWELPHANQFKK